MLLGKSLKLPTSTLKKVHDVLPLLLKVLKKKKKEKKKKPARLKTF